MPTWDLTLWNPSQDDGIWVSSPSIAPNWSAALFYRPLVGDQVVEIMGWGAYPYSPWVWLGNIPVANAPWAYRAGPAYCLDSTGRETTATVVVYPEGSVVIGSADAVWQVWFDFIYSRY